MGGIQEESGESLKDMNAIYWPHPEFKDGMINIKSLIAFLINSVPSYCEEKSVNNAWQKGIPFLVYIYNKDSHKTITFECTLDVRESGETICTQCEQKEVTSGIQTEVADQVSGIMAS